MPGTPARSGFIVHIDGRDADAGELAPLAFSGYAHFTAMQVRGGRLRGLDLHLQRLRGASLQLFGQAPPDEAVRALLRRALAAGPPDLSLMATVYSPAGEFTATGADVALRVLVRTAAPASRPPGPLKLALVEHERALPTLKHVGEVAKTYYLREAVKRGFDDAVFVDRHGRLSEGTIWNLAFWDGEAVVWPKADMLEGTMMATVRRQLRRMGVPQREREIRRDDVSSLTGAVVMNSWTPGVAVERIGDIPMPAAAGFLELLRRAHSAEPLVSP